MPSAPGPHLMSAQFPAAQPKTEDRMELQDGVHASCTCSGCLLFLHITLR
uniref:Uncharacterized protein n=1 Tax=Anguilla anguilla TaxID=7936 RepID=A0A0E9QQQ7_ANGAN